MLTKKLKISEYEKILSFYNYNKKYDNIHSLKKDANNLIIKQMCKNNNKKYKKLFYILNNKRVFSPNNKMKLNITSKHLCNNYRNYINKSTRTRSPIYL